MIINCPCCDKPMNAGETPEILLEVSMSETRKSIVSALIDAYPRRLLRNQVVQRSLVSDVSLNVVISKIREKIEPYGWTIICSHGGRGTSSNYRLERCDAD